MMGKVTKPARALKWWPVPYDITIGIIQPCDMTELKLEEIALLHLSEWSKDKASS